MSMKQVCRHQNNTCIKDDNLRGSTASLQIGPASMQT